MRPPRPPRLSERLTDMDETPTTEVQKKSRVNRAKTIGFPRKGKSELIAGALIDALERKTGRPILDEDEYCVAAEMLHAKTELNTPDIVELLAEDPILAGRIVALLILGGEENLKTAALYVEDYMEGKR